MAAIAHRTPAPALARTHDDDPLAAALAPPPGETPAQRAARLRAEDDARAVSAAIDRELQAERAELRRRRAPVKVLLLGQSESGKSTTLKNFQLTYAPKAWADERASWRAVVQLNLVRAATALLDGLAHELARAGPGARAPTADSEHDPNADPDPDAEPDAEPDPDADLPDAPAAGSSAAAAAAAAAAAPAALVPRDGKEPRPPPLPPATEAHAALVRRLGALRRVQAVLEARLGAGAAEAPAAPASAPAPASASASASGAGVVGRGAQQEFGVRAGGAWKALRAHAHARAEGRGGADADAGAERDVADALAAARADLGMLWGDALVRALVRTRGVRLSDSAEFFLDSAARVAAPEYVPATDDVVRARLRTVGVQEHRVLFEVGPETGHEWLIYDVGGARSSRAAWPAFFDDVHALLFLAPLAAFDERLAEDGRVNRLEDSFALWRAVCANRLLADAQLVLFLNKCDVLRAKLRAGVRLARYMPAFGARANDYAAVTKYLRGLFSDICKQQSPKPRQLHIHLTSVVDTRETAVTLGAVQESILREHLRRLHLIY